MSSSQESSADHVAVCAVEESVLRMDSYLQQTNNNPSLTYYHCSFSVQLTMSYCMIKKVGIII